VVQVVGRTWLSADGRAGVEMAGGGWAGLEENSGKGFAQEDGQSISIRRKIRC